MKTLFDLDRELTSIRSHNPDAFGVFYRSKSDPNNRHYVILRSPQELANLKEFHRDYDFVFNVLAI